MLELEEEFTVEEVTKVPKGQRFRRNGRGDYHKVNGDYPSTWARRVIKKYVGKTYEEAFEYFCTLVPDYQQKWFHQEFVLSRGWWTPTDKYELDDNNIIRIVEKETKKGPFIFESYDYKVGYKNNRDKRIYIPKNKWDRSWEMSYIKDHPEKYTEFVVSGYKKEFESDKDREYIRLMKEKNKLRKLDGKNKKKEKEKVAYSFLTKEESERRANYERDLAIDKVKVQKHGFNDESFKGLEYHGQKRKLKTD